MASKVHIVLHHLPQYLRLTLTSLGTTGEEVVEQQHHLFKVFYQRYKVRTHNQELYQDSLKRAVSHFNFYHL